MKVLTDKEIIDAIRAGGQEAEKALGQLYSDSRFRHAAAIAARYFDSNTADVADIFQEGLWRLFQLIKQGTFEERSSLKTCFSGICKNICFNEFTTRKRRAEILAKYPIGSEAEDPWDDETFSWKDKGALLEKALSDLGDACHRILEYWAGGYSMKEIVDLLEYKDEMAAKNKKKNCLQKLRDWMLEHPAEANLFKEGL